MSLTNVTESFYRDSLRGTIRVNLIPSSMEMPCEILVAITPKCSSLDGAIAFVDRLAINKQFLMDCLDESILGENVFSRRDTESVKWREQVRASA